MKKNGIVDESSRLTAFLETHKLDAFFINDTDRYLNEYVPKNQTHYFLLTGFSGSTCKLLLLKGQKSRIYVDGRYHEQAEIECDKNLLDVIKCPQSISIFNKMVEDLNELKIQKLGVDGQRTSVMEEEVILKNSKVNIQHFDHDELLDIVPLEKTRGLNELTHLDLITCGVDPITKAKTMVKDDEIYFISALDSIAWLTNTRGFHLPYQSTFMARCIVSANQIYLYNIEEQSYACHFPKEISFKQIPLSRWEDEVNDVARKLKPSKVFFDKESLTAADYRILQKVFSKDQLSNPREKILFKQSLKNISEIKVLEDCYHKSSLAVAKTIREIKKMVTDRKTPSEKDLSDLTWENYKKQGAVDLSFKTIAACGANASIIHYGSASENVKMKNGDMILLDSGALYQSGYATDKTRTFTVGKIKNYKLKEMYTLVLKGLLNAQNAIVPEGTVGAAIDMLARHPILQHGYNYLHGTGHGIGIATHEGGIGFSFKNSMPIKEGQVVSVEPGIYIPDLGGVRLENVIVVEKNPKMEGTLKFRPLVYIGFDQELVDFDLLTDEELEMYDRYEDECRGRGTHI